MGLVLEEDEVREGAQGHNSGERCLGGYLCRSRGV